MVPSQFCLLGLLPLQSTRAQSMNFSGAIERKERSTQGPIAILPHQCEQQLDQQLPCFTPHVGLLLHYNRQGRKVKNLRSKCNTRAQKGTQYRDQQRAYCTQREQQCDQRLLYVSLHRGPQPLATPDGLQPLPGGWHNHDTLILDTPR